MTIQIIDCRKCKDPLEDPIALAQLEPVRREKILRNRDPKTRKLLLGAGILLQNLLLAHGLTSDHIDYESYGKPRIIGSEEPLEFSLSHAGTYALLVSGAQQVGCDIEERKPLSEDIAGAVFSQKEQEWIHENTGPQEELLRFYRIWTARESYIKMTGEGMHLDFQEYEIIQDHNKVRTIEKWPESISAGVKDLGSARVLRNGIVQPAFISQWELDAAYVISICTTGEE